MTAWQRSNITQRSEKGLGPISFKRILLAGGAGGIMAMIGGRLIGFFPGCLSGAIILGVVLAITHPVEGLALYAFLGRSLRSLAALALIHNRGGLLPAVGRVMQVSADEGTVLGSSVYNVPDEDREGDRELDPGWEYLGGFGDVKGEGLSAAPNPFHQEGEHEQ